MSIKYIALGWLVMSLLVVCKNQGTNRSNGLSEIQITPMDNSIPNYKEAELKITSPKQGEVIDGTEADLSFSLGGFELGVPTPGAAKNKLAKSKDGQHLHFIHNNGEYMAHYDASPIKLKNLAEGFNYVIAFPSRMWHESVKSAAAVTWTYFYVKSKDASITLDTKAPYLVYSRPKGTYKGADAEQVMLDFYLINAELGQDKFKVKVTIDGTAFGPYTSWQPYIITGLAAGEHTIKLELLDAKGVPVPGPTNSTTRKIKIEK